MLMSLVLPAKSADLPDRSWALPALLLLLIQIALYVWMAPRGFEFTDESYYFHNYLHWREFTGTATFFGAYFEWPFRAMHRSVGAARVLSLAMILASSAVLMREVLRFSMREQPPAERGSFGWWFLAAPMASAMMYFGGSLTTLRAPSYNLLSLCTMALTTACLLRTLQTQTRGHTPIGAPLLYGVALGACVLSKATTALPLLLVHIVFFIAVNRVWHVRRLLALAGLVTAGAGLNLLVLTLAFPDWLQSLREGVELISLRGGGHSAMEIMSGFRWDIQIAIETNGVWMAGLGILFVVVLRQLRSGSARGISLLALVLVTMVAITLIHSEKTLWLFAMAGATVGLWCIERLGRTPGPMSGSERADFGLMALLLSLPLIYSAGTNNSILKHSVMASMFAYCAVYLRLYVLRRKGMLNAFVLAISVCLLCLPALAAQLLAMTQVKYTYRQLTGLGTQNHPVLLAGGTSTVLVDAGTEQSLREILALAHAAGFQPGQDVLDLTGDGPGIIYALGANPLGTPWMLGGYKGSTVATIRIIDKIDPAALRHAWLLTSSDNPLRLTDWETVLEQRIGTGSHVMVGDIKITRRYGWSLKSQPSMSLQLWKPLAASGKDD